MPVNHDVRLMSPLIDYVLSVCRHTPVTERKSGGVLVLLTDLPYELVHDRFTWPAQEEPRRQTGYQAAA